VVGTGDEEELGAPDAGVQLLGIVRRHGVVIRAAKDERRASDLFEAAPAVGAMTV
jgi:hypothetical protein